MNQCPKCKGKIVGVEYPYTNKHHYDGVSEWMCQDCHYREGRWSHRELGLNEYEPVFGVEAKPYLLNQRNRRRT